VKGFSVGLYTWLNKRHHDKFTARMERQLDDITAGVAVTRSWDEWEALRDARQAEWEARPLLVKATDRIRIYLFGLDGLLTKKLTPRNIVNRIVWDRQRATRGWCDSDCWNVDGYITRVLAGMLAHLAEHNQAYPGCPPFETPEKWSAHLRDLSVRLRAWTDEEDELTPLPGLEVTKQALAEFTENLSMYWD
jgi:hypothetical protein